MNSDSLWKWSALGAKLEYAFIKTGIVANTAFGN